MPPLMQLPAYEIKNALVNFEPLNNGLDSIRTAQVQNKRLQQTDTELGMNQERLKLEQEKAGREAEQYHAQKFGGMAQQWLNEQDPNKQKMLFDQFTNHDPRIKTAIAKNLPPEVHNDPVVVGRYLTTLAQGYQNPLDVEAKRAGIEHSRAATAGAIGTERRAAEMQPLDILAKNKAIEASKIIKMKEDEDLAVQDPSAPNGVRFINRTPGEDRVQRGFDKEYAKEAPKLYTKAGETYTESKQTAQTIGDMEALAKHASTGWGAEGLNQLRRAASRMGIADSDKIAPTELFRALSQKFVLQEGQKLKPMSNADVTFVEKGLATIMSDPSTLPVLLPALRREAERNAAANLLRMNSLRRGTPPNEEAIFAEVDAKFPSIIREVFGANAQQAAQSIGPAQTQVGVRSGPAMGEKVEKPNQARLGDAAPGNVVLNWDGKNLLGPDGKPAQAAPQPAQPPAPQDSPAARSAARRAEASQRFNAEREVPKAAAQQQFDVDARRMDPLSLAQKYDGMRGMLAPQQLSVLNAILERAVPINALVGR